jgi:hypothetical protein
MGVLISPDSTTGKMLRRWETPKNRLVDPDAMPGDPFYHVYGERPVGHEEYPKMLYRALPTRSGKVESYQGPPDPFFFPTQPEYDRAVQDVENFNKRCTLVVQNESQHRRARTDGWRDSIADALEQYEQDQREIGNLAAERAYSDQRMSARAQAEMAAAEAKTHEHLPTLKPPKKRPYRRKVFPKVTPAVTE